LSWHAKQSIPNIIVTFYADCVKIYEDFAPKLCRQRKWQLHHDTAVSHFLFHQGIFTKNNMTVVPPTGLLSLFLRLKIKLKSSQFDTAEVMEAESQKVLNILAQRDFNNAFKMAEALGMVHTSGRKLLRG
jgi:hypothetical protein